MSEENKSKPVGRKRKGRTLKTLLIDPFKQIKFGLYILGVTIGFLVASGVMFFQSFVEQYQHVIEIFSVVDPTLKDEMLFNQVFKQNSINLALVFVAFLAVMMTLIFRMTHRYYGPLVAIDKFSEKIAAGRYHVRIKLRNKDELHELAGKLNAMAAELERKHGGMVEEDGTKIERRGADRNATEQETIDEDDERLEIHSAS